MYIAIYTNAYIYKTFKVILVYVLIIVLIRLVSSVCSK